MEVKKVQKMKVVPIEVLVRRGACAEDEPFMRMCESEAQVERRVRRRRMDRRAHLRVRACGVAVWVVAVAGIAALWGALLMRLVA